MKRKVDLYFYDKLFNSNPIFDSDSCKPKANRTFFPKRLLTNMFRLILAAIYILKLFFLKKNKIIFFNHTQRFRKNTSALKIPLYLNGNIFTASDFHIVDDFSKKISDYHGPQCAIDISCIRPLFSALSVYMRFLNFFKADPLSPQAISFYSKRNVWSWILAILKPRQLIFIVWYAYQPIIAAAKKQSISTVDLQHGIIYAQHPFYNLNDTKITNFENLVIPDQCWVYGNYWKKQLTQSGWNKNSVKIFGYYLNIPPVNRSNANSQYILYTTSCNANKEELVCHVNSILDEVRSRGLKIIISPHPNEQKENYFDLISDIVTLSDNDSYTLLRDCEIHISAISTLLWEGLYFDKPTYILALNKYQNHINILDELITNGLARPIETGQFPEKFDFKSNLDINEYFTSPVDHNLFIAV